MPIIADFAIAVVCLALAAAFALNRTRRLRRKVNVFYDGPQRITYWPTLQESAKSMPSVLRLRITDDMIHVTPVRHHSVPARNWHFVPSSAVVFAVGDDVLLTTDQTTFCMHARAGDEDLLQLLRAAGTLLRAA